MAELYPCALPGVLINSNGFAPQSLVRNNVVKNGPLRFRLQADSGWLQFNVAWSFGLLEGQVFENWHEHTLANGSKSFLIDLKVPGGLLEHECYFLGVPSYNQIGARWSVTGTLMAINRVGLTECDGLSLVNMHSVFPEPNLAITQMNDAILELESSWLP